MAYMGRMQDVMGALKLQKAKAEAKLARASKALETAKKELLDIEAAERVFSAMTGESPVGDTVGSAGSDRDKAMTKLLGTMPEQALTPAELHPLYVAETEDTINLDAFRTALWRLQKKIIAGAEKDWTVRSEGGRYWREPASSPNDALLLETEEASETN